MYPKDGGAEQNREAKAGAAPDDGRDHPALRLGDDSALLGNRLSHLVTI